MNQFLYPIYFLLLPLPLLIRKFLSLEKSGRDKAIDVPFYKDISNIKANSYFSGGKKFRFSILLLWIIWGLLVVATARPRWVGDEVKIQTVGRNLMMAIDLSGSMQIDDFKLNGESLSRLEIVKKLAKDFILRRKGDRLGLVLFGTKPYLHTPLTLDIKTLQSVLDEIDIGLAGKQTAIADAIGLSCKNLRKINAKDKILILLTDGYNNAGELKIDDAIELAKSENIKIYTIGMGAKSAKKRSLFGYRTYNPSKDLDEKSLQKIAKETGGYYFRAVDTKSLENIYKKIDKLEETKGDKMFVKPVIELYYYPLFLALIISFLMAFYKILISFRGRL